MSVPDGEFIFQILDVDSDDIDDSTWKMTKINGIDSTTVLFKYFKDNAQQIIPEWGLQSNFKDSRIESSD